MQRAVLHQHSGHRAAALVHARFQHRSARRHSGIGLQLAQVAHQQNHFEQLGEVLFRLGRDFHHDGIAAPFFGHQAFVGKLALHAFGLRVRLINFVDRHDDRHSGSARVRNSFFGLRHHAVVRCNHQHHDVRDFCAARTHTRERLVTRRIHEYDALALHVRFIRADVLRDSSRFTARHICFADGVQQACLAVVHVTHHRDHGRARHFIARALFLDLFFLHQLLFESDNLYDAVERLGQARGRRHVESLVDAREYAAIEQCLQQILRANIEFFGEFAHRDSFRHRQRTRLAFYRRNRFDRCRTSTRAYACARTNRMQLALAFRVTLLDERTAARCRLARVKRLAWFGFRYSRAGTLPANGSFIIATARTATTAGARREP